MAKEKKEGLDRVVSTVFLLLLSILCIVFSGCLLFVSKINEKILCYVFMGAIIAWGVTLIARYFGKKSYKKMHDYNFSFGVFLLIVGCCGLVRIHDIVASFDVLIGIVVLLIGILLLQTTIQLRSMNSSLWTADLLLAIIITICSILLLMNVSFIAGYPTFAYWVLFVASIANTLNFPLLGIKIFINNKREEKANRVQVTQTTISTDPVEVIEADIKEVEGPKLKKIIKKEDPIVLTKEDLPRANLENK